LDGQIWALKADSLTSPLIVTVTDFYFRALDISTITHSLTSVNSRVQTGTDPAVSVYR